MHQSDFKSIDGTKAICMQLSTAQTGRVSFGRVVDPGGTQSGTVDRARASKLSFVKRLYIYLLFAGVVRFIVMAALCDGVLFHKTPHCTRELPVQTEFVLASKLPLYQTMRCAELLLESSP